VERDELSDFGEKRNFFVGDDLTTKQVKNSVNKFY
jgi:hypothetical protein